jgi:hypothetical protein
MATNTTAVVNAAAGPRSLTTPAGDLVEIIPLGAGQEVGRSCVVLKYQCVSSLRWRGERERDGKRLSSPA